MTLKIKKSGSMVTPSAIKRKSGGSFVNVGFVKIKKSGSWVQIWPLIGSLTGHSVLASGSTSGASTARYYVDSDGYIYTKQGTAAIVQQEQWLIAGTNTDYEVRFTQTGSTGSGGLNGTLSTWLGTGTDREINATTTAGNTYDTDVTVEIREASSGVVLATVSVNLTADWF